MGYTDSLDKAMRDEPEAVSREVQEGLSADARARRRAEYIEEISASRTVIQSVLDHLAERPYATALRDDMRAIRAALDRMPRAL